MSKSIRDYFKFHLGNMYNAFPCEFIGDIDVALKNVKDILTDDIRFYPQYSDFAWNDENLVKIMQLNVSLEAVVLYRIENYLFRQFVDHPMLDYLANMMKIRSGAELYYSSEIGPGFRVLHSHGIVLGPRNQIGKNFSIYQNVTVGQTPGSDDKAIIGDNVYFCSGSKIIGNLTIGDNTILGTNAVLLQNADSNSTYVGVPARKVIKAK